MFVGIVRIELHLPGSSSLKDKRAIVPAFGMLKTLRTSALPSSFSLNSGARRPAMAFFTSSTAS